MSEKNKIEDLQRGMESLFEFSSEKEEIDHGASMLSLRLLKALKDYLKQEGISQAEFAKRIGTSRSYVTQVFTGDKLVNMKLLYRIEKEFGIRFDFGLAGQYNQWPETYLHAAEPEPGEELKD